MSLLRLGSSDSNRSRFSFGGWGLFRLAGCSLLFAVDAEAAVWRSRKSKASQFVSRPCRLMPAGSGLSTRSSCASFPREWRLSLARIQILARSLSILYYRRGQLRDASGGGAFFSEAKFDTIDPHLMEGGREIAGDRDPGSRYAAKLGDRHAPGARSRPPLAA
jgi:hypothetical protein